MVCKSCKRYKARHTTSRIGISVLILQGKHHYCSCILLPPSSPSRFSWCHPPQPFALVSTMLSKTWAIQIVSTIIINHGVCPHACADRAYDDSCNSVETWVYQNVNPCTVGEFTCSPPPVQITGAKILNNWYRLCYHSLYHFGVSNLTSTVQVRLSPGSKFRFLWRPLQQLLLP